MSQPSLPERNRITLDADPFREAPGYDPLSLHGDAARFAVPPTQLLVSARLEETRGGRLDITEFVSPASDLAMDFHQEVTLDTDGMRSGIACVLSMTSFCATVIYNDAPDPPQRSGIYFWLPSSDGRHSYPLEESELLVGHPTVHTLPAPHFRQLVDGTDTHSVEAHRVVADTNQLTDVVNRFGEALGLGQADRVTLMRRMVGHVRAARGLRRIRALDEVITAKREARG